MMEVEWVPQKDCSGKADLQLLNWPSLTLYELLPKTLDWDQEILVQHMSEIFRVSLCDLGQYVCPT